MAARFGNVLYWAGCIFAVIALAAASVLAFGLGDEPHPLAAPWAVAAVVVWLIGRAARYILSDR